MGVSYLILKQNILLQYFCPLSMSKFYTFSHYNADYLVHIDMYRGGGKTCQSRYMKLYFQFVIEVKEHFRTKIILRAMKHEKDGTNYCIIILKLSFQVFDY